MHYNRRQTHKRSGHSTDRAWFSAVVVLSTLGGAVQPTRGAEGSGNTPTPLIVATRHVPPFAIRRDDGTWEGISIELWRSTARKLDLSYEFREVPLDQMLEGLRNRTFDAAVAALTVTADRETEIDFTHAYHDSGLGIVVPGRNETGWVSVIRSLLSFRLAAVVGALALLLFSVGVLVWLFERRRNPDQFAEGRSRGLTAAFWWAAVTMTTVGYGDKSPRTLGGRVVALVWMFASILLISSFTAAITTALTVSQLDSGIDGPEDLPGLQVATVAGSTSEAYLRTNRVRVITVAGPAEAIDAVAAGQAEAAVYDAPVLRFLTTQRPGLGVRVLPRSFERQAYAIALPEGSTLREPINRVLVREIAAPPWEDMLYRYLGGS